MFYLGEEGGWRTFLLIIFFQNDMVYALDIGVYKYVYISVLIKFVVGFIFQQIGALSSFFQNHTVGISSLGTHSKFMDVLGVIHILLMQLKLGGCVGLRTQMLKDACGGVGGWL